MTGLHIPGIEGLRYFAGGGFADVYRGVQSAFGREVAVKVIRGGAADDTVRRRFERECRILGSLSNHPNIVTVHDLGWLATGEPYLVMPFLPGGTIQDRLSREGQIPLAEAAMICAKVARALDVAHNRGVVHCDVKPANVLVTEFGEPQIGDFGIARLASESSATAVAFTPNYAAPEVLRSAEPEPRRDVYALGAMLCALITGRAPFSRSGADDVMSVMMRISEEPPPDLVPYGVPVSMQHVVERSMAKDPAQRFPTAERFAAAVEDAARGINGDIGMLPTIGLAGPSTVGHATGSSRPNVSGPGVSGPGVSGPGVSGPGVPGPGGFVGPTGVAPAGDARWVTPAAVLPTGGARAASAGVAPARTGSGGWDNGLDALPPATVATPHTALVPAPRRSRSRGTWLGIFGAVALLAIAVVTLATSRAGRDSTKPTVSTSGPTVETATLETLGATVPETVTPAETVGSGVSPSTVQSAPRVGRVVNTCGADGTGDCFVALRSAPSSASKEFGRLNEGASVSVVCQTLGENVTSSGLGGTTDLWAGTNDGAYISSAYLDGAGLDPYEQTLPSCDGSTPDTKTPPSTEVPSKQTPTTQIAATPTIQSQDPATVVMAFYDAVQNGDFETAWTLGGKNFGRPFETFAAGYENTVAQDIVIESVDGNLVTVTLTAKERTKTGSVTSTYKGTYEVRAGEIVSGKLRKI